MVIAIFGITLNQAEKLKDSKIKSKWINYLLLKESKKKIKTVSVRDLTLAQMVTLENSLQECDFKTFCSIFVKRKLFQTVYFHNLKNIMLDYAEQKRELFEQYNWLSNPPSYGEPPAETIGSEIRKEFVESFGSYVVLTDVVCKGDITKYKEVEKWNITEFLFWADYLTGQKLIGNIK